MAMQPDNVDSALLKATIAISERARQSGYNLG
jgi:hypothetical protein